MKYCIIHYSVFNGAESIQKQFPIVLSDEHLTDLSAQIANNAPPDGYDVMASMLNALEILERRNAHDRINVDWVGCLNRKGWEKRRAALSAAQKGGM